VLSVDNWAIIDIRREDLTLPDERPHLTISSRSLGYYYVDPLLGRQLEFTIDDN
jgi:hypothetical protein